MIIKELGRDKNGRLTTFEIDYHQISFGGLKRYLKRLPGLIITSSSCWPMTDDCLVEFNYKGYKFSIDSPFVHFWINSYSPECPETIFSEVIEHLRQFKIPWWRRSINEKVDRL